MVDRSKSRSSSYQYVICESPCSPELLTEVSDAQGMTGFINLNSHSEELLDLNERFVAAFWRIVDTQLTERQREVLHLYAEGFTQIEIAKKLNVNQSSITKSINGNADYANVGNNSENIDKKGRKKRRVYGGAKKKINKIAATDVEMQEILKRMKELQEEMDF